MSQQIGKVAVMLVSFPRLQAKHIANLRFSGSATPEGLSDFSLAWSNPAIRERFRQKMLSGDFKYAPQQAEVMVTEIDRLASLPLSDEERYTRLRQFFLAMPQSTVKASFHRRSSELLNEKIQRLSQALTPSSITHVLDVGAGNGAFAAKLKEKLGLSAGQVRGLEVVSWDELHPPPIPITQFDGESYPVPGQSVDLVTLMSVLHHAAEPTKLLQEAYRALRPGGMLVVQEFDHGTDEKQRYHYLTDNMAFRVFRDIPDMPPPSQLRSQGEWLDTFRQVGFFQKPIQLTKPEYPSDSFIVLLQKRHGH